MSKWESYHTYVGKSPNTLVVRAMEHVSQKGAALDIGAGNLRDSWFLVDQGFEDVVAVDSDEISRQFIHPWINLHTMPIADFDMGTDRFDFVACCNVFFHIDRSQVEAAVGRVLKGLRPKGVFVCNVLGERNSFFSNDVEHPRYTIETVASLTVGFDILGIGEEERRDHSDWFRAVSSPSIHVWNLMLRKP